jgi:hypothetical protein
MQNAECRMEGNGGGVAGGLGSFRFWRFGERACPGRYAGRAGFVLSGGFAAGGDKLKHVPVRCFWFMRLVRFVLPHGLEFAAGSGSFGGTAVEPLAGPAERLLG